MNRKLMLLAILVAAILVTMKFNQSNPVLVLTITWGVFFLYKKIYQIPDNKKIKAIAFIYTLLLSFAVIVGSQVNYVSIRSKMNENFIGINSFSVVGAILLAFLLYPAIVFLISQIEKYSFKDNSVCVSTRNLKIFLIAWIIIFSFWVPYLLSFYPAGIVGDGASTLEYSIQEGIPDRNHWVILYILVLRLFLKIGSIFNADINFGIFLYAIAESLLFSAVCALVVMTLRKKGVPEKWVWSSIALYALSGFFASYSMVLWKDGLFAAGVVLLVLLLWDYPEKGMPSLRYCLLYGGLCLFLCFWRNNGVYIVLLCELGILFLLKKRGKRIVATGLAAIAITLIIQGPIYDGLGIKKDSLVESFSIPLQQVAAVINEDAELTEEQEEIVFSVIPEEIWRENYCPALSDDLKNAVDAEYLKNHVGDFLKVWAQLLVPNFSTYVKAYLMQTLGYWQPGVFQGNYWDYWIGVEDIFERGWSQRDLVQEITGISIRSFLESRMDFISSGTMVWLLLLSCTIVICQKNNQRKRLLILLPLCACWAIIMVAAPIAYAYRYIVMLPMALPIICALPFLDKDFGTV